MLCDRFDSMTQIEFSRSFARYPVEQLADAGVGLATVDLDKVLADYNLRTVYSSALNTLEAMHEHGIATAVVTNCNDPERLDDVMDQIFRRVGYVGLPHKGMLSENGDILKPKPAPDLFIDAAARANVSPDAKRVHFDDQFKAFYGARAAGFDSFIWLYPAGRPLRQHPGVMVGRFVEVPIGFGYIARQRLSQRSLRSHSKR